MTGWRDDADGDAADPAGDGDGHRADGGFDGQRADGGFDGQRVAGESVAQHLDGAFDARSRCDEIVVLHVDDDESVLDLTAEFLGRVADDFDVRSAVGAPAGLDVLASERVDCVVSDYQMPEMDGLAFLERVRDTHPDLPFVLFTGEGSASVASDAIAAGATDYVPKGGGSDHYEVLANRVRNAVEAVRAKRAVERTAVSDGDVVRRDAFTESLLESLHGVFFVFEVGEGLVDWNARFEAVTGHDPETLAGAPPTLFLPDSYHDRARADAKTIRDGGAVRYDGEIETAAGEHVPYEIHVASHEDPDGRLFGVGFGQEITERVEREARIRERKEQLETIVENFPVVAFTVDPTGVFTNSVGAGLAALDVEPGELVGESIYEVYGEYDEIIENFDVALAGESAESTVSIDGVTFETRYEPVVDDGAVTQVAGVAFDVSDRVAQREALEAKNERLEEFASVLSHDLRNPLSVAAGTLEVLESHVDEAGREHLETVRTAQDRMTRIVDDVLALARGGGDVETKPVSGAQVAALAVENVATTTVDVDVAYDAVIDANEGSLARLVENLVRNAVEHGGERVVVGSLADDPGFYVADDGPGLPVDVDESLFEAGVTTDDRGTGLGLAIVSDIADAHGWTLSTTTDPDLGGARIAVRNVDRA